MSGHMKLAQPASRNGMSGATSFGLRALVAATLVTIAGQLSAEGSRSLYPSGYVGTRAAMDLQDAVNSATVSRNRAFIYAYAEAGEYILLGSSNRDDGNIAGVVQVFDPQSFGNRGNETRPVNPDFECNVGEIFEPFNTTAPALPTGWATTNDSGTSVAWTTSNAVPQYGNNALINGPATASVNSLRSATYTVAATPARLAFYRAHPTMDAGQDDGLVLEISINGGAFADALAGAGSAFELGGYQAAITSGTNTLNGRQAWVNSITGYEPTIYRLPNAAVAGSNVQFRWRMATNGDTASAGVRIDSVAGSNLAGTGTHFFGETTAANDVTGEIRSRVQELAGPNSANNTVTVTNGWRPCAYRAPVTGVYGVQFTGSDTGGTGTPPTSLRNLATDMPELQVYTAGWEVVVRANATSTADLSGRVFTYAWMARTPGNVVPDDEVNHTLYYVTSDGYRYSQRLNRLNPFTYGLWANRAGFFDSNGVDPLYKDVRGNNINVTTLLPGPANITAQRPEYPVFFANPAGNAQAELVLTALSIPTVPPVPQLNSVSFVGNVSGITSSLGSGGTFTFTTTNTLTYQIVVSRDGVNFDPSNPLNATITGTTPGGIQNVVWDGNDNAGNDFPVGNGYVYRIDGRNGEAHFPLVDTEGMAGGGMTITKLNGSSPGNTTVYYDDRGYVTSNGTAVGELNGHLCGAGNAQVQPSPNQALSGTDSSVAYRTYAPITDSNTDCNNSAASAFASAKVLDTWALELTPAIPGELNIVPTANEPVLTIVKTGVPGPINVSTATSTTYTLSVTNNGTGATVGNIVINDALRAGLALTSFVGTNWNCTGPTSVVCTYTGPALAAGGGSTSVQITVSIAQFTIDANNTGRVSGGGDDVCLPPPAVLSPANALRCTSTVTIGTVPVTLSYVKSSVSNNILTVEFMTLAEAGTAGFRVLGAASESADRTRLAPLLLAKGSSLAPQSYRIDVPHAGERQIWIEEVVSDGLSTVYGPYSVGTIRGEAIAGDLIDWPSIRAAVNSYEAAQLASIRARGTGAGLEAEVRLSESGIARITYSDLLAQGIDWSGQDPRQVELLLGEQRLPLRYSGPASIGSGSIFQFLGAAIEDSLYTRTQVYRLRVSDGEARSMSTENASPVGPAFVEVVRDWMLHAPNREYDLSARNSDPYSAFRLTRSTPATVARTETFTLNDLSTAGRTLDPNGGNPPDSDQIEIEVWSGFDTPHLAQFVLNGTALGTLEFSGRAAQSFSATLPAGLLRRGANDLRVELLDTGNELDSINLESIRVNYQRSLVATNNRLSFVLPESFVSAGSSDRVFADGFSDEGISTCLPTSACVGYRVSGLTTPDVLVMRQRGGEVTQLTNIRMSGSGSAFQAEFATSPLASDRYWIAPASGGVPLAVQPALPVVDPLAGGPASYLIIAHGSLISGLTPFINARQADGFTVRVVDVQDLYRHYGTGAVDPATIQEAIADAAQRLGTRYVLLVGGDTRDYFNLGGNGSLSFIPTLYRQVGPIVTFAPTDVPFADLDGNNTLDLAIGRWPVRNLAELGFVIQKTLQYGQADHANKLLLLSDRDQGTVEFDVQARLVPMNLGPSWQAGEIPLQSHPGGLVQARSDMVQAINSGQAMTVYMGHGAPLSWSIDSLVTSQLLNNGLLNNPTRPTVAWTVGCYGTYFTQPAYNSVSHGLLGRNASGAAAVFGASTLTEISNDIVWLNMLSPRLRGQRLGDSLRAAQNQLVGAGEQYRDIWLSVSLLGDPALRLNEAR